MSLIEKLQQWKTDLEALGLEKVKAEGRLEQAMDDLAVLGYDSIEAAEKALWEMIVKKEAVELEAEKLLEEFNAKYAEFIE